MNRWVFLCLVLAGGVTFDSKLPAVELVELSAENWEQFAPQGKEVDCIYGDYVLRNEHLVAVIARPGSGRNANMTVRGVGGAVIDLTRRNPQSDQLSAFYPTAGKYAFHDPAKVRCLCDDQAAKPIGGEVISGEKITVEILGETAASQPAGAKPADKIAVTLRYTLTNDDDSLLIESSLTNADAKPVTVERSDAIRADKSFAFGGDPTLHLHWAYDEWFRQAYAVVAKDFEIKPVSGRLLVMQFLDKDGKSDATVQPGESVGFSRRLIPAADLLAAKATAAKLLQVPSIAFQVIVTDPAGAVDNAKVTVTRGGNLVGSGRTDSRGAVSMAFPAGKGEVVVEAQGRPMKSSEFNLDANSDRNNLVFLPVKLEACGYAAGKITDADGGPIPCKIAFHGKMPTKTPNFGPDSKSEAVQNLRYTGDGQFRQELAPGTYEVVISRGPEYDAVFCEIEVIAGKETPIAAKLIRTVDTRGWVSSDFHSHSTPSGDNTSEQFGRVLNLLAENIEFAPCTEHNRIDSYTPHLQRLKAERWMATCTGMELTGAVLPVNHQNAFPLIHKPRMQDGGAPLVDLNPEVQIERLAMWDGGSDKLVQENHPNLVQILGDKDLDGKPDGGFAKMLGFMDVVEVHPPTGILTPPKPETDKDASRNPMFTWMQMLNLGYRITGVVNTDAHYNAHGSGWLRNFIRSSTDDPAEIDTMAMVHASEAGRIVMSTGPFMEVDLTATSDGKPVTVGPGENLAAASGTAELHVRVQCPNWLDINRVQVFVNGRPVKELNFTRRDTPARFGGDVVKFDQRLPLELKHDSHVIVAAVGEGLKLGRVMGETFGKETPIAVSNPIFVHVNGGGFEPNKDLLDVPLPIAIK